MTKSGWVKTFKNFQIFVPASISNLGCGFDTLGLAVSLYFKTSVFSSPNFAIRMQYNSKPLDLANDDNLFLQVLRHCYPVSPDEWQFKILIETEIPLRRGIGSSACAVLSAILMAAKLLNLRQETAQILKTAMLWEPHPDNLCACLLGGFTVAMQDENGEVFYHKLSFPRSLRIMLLIPECEISTKQARGLLPEAYKKEAVVSNLQRLAYFMACMQEGSFQSLKESVRDQIHQPYRAPLMSFAHDLLDTTNFPPETAVVISGSGPTFAVLYRVHQKKIRSVIQQIMSSYGVGYDLRSVIVDHEGARVESMED